MAKVQFKRYETDTEAQESDVIDGQLIVTKEGSVFVDYGNERIPTGGLTLTTIFNAVYPVGSYYETSDTTFNPNVTWSGTWVLDSAGKVTVSKDENDNDFNIVGKTGGSKELQTHTHTIVASTTLANLGSGGTGTYIGSGTTTTSSAGTGDSGNLQPYIVVNRWHRTA